MSPMTKIVVGDRDHYVDPNVAREIDMLRGENAALRAMRDGAVLPVATQRGSTAASTAHLSDREFWRAHEAAKYDPATPLGGYAEYLRNAHKGGR